MAKARTVTRSRKGVASFFRVLRVRKGGKSEYLNPSARRKFKTGRRTVKL